MKIIIKPIGAVLLGTGIVVLATLALRSNVPPAPSLVISEPAPTAKSAGAIGDKTAVIYRDGFENGWNAQGWSWVKDAAYDDRKHTHGNGGTAIRAHLVGYEGVKFHHTPLNVTKYDRFSFFVNGGETGGQKLQVGGESDDPKGGKAVPGVGVHLSALPPKQWVAVTVPLRDLKLDNHPGVSSFWVQGDTDKSPSPGLHRRRTVACSGRSDSQWSSLDRFCPLISPRVESENL